MTAVRRATNELLGDDYVIEPKNEDINLLSTIKVPKNLLYLTDRLPKPHYEVRVDGKMKKVPQTQKSKKEKMLKSDDSQPLPEITNPYKSSSPQRKLES